MKQPATRNTRPARVILPVALGTAGVLTRGGDTSGSENKRKIYSSTTR
ncbi:albusnodin family lasso peptide [Embleya sp. NPDC050493]